MWNQCFSGSRVGSREHQPVLACQTEIGIMYTAIKCSKILSEVPARGGSAGAAFSHPAPARGNIQGPAWCKMGTSE